MCRRRGEQFQAGPALHGPVTSFPPAATRNGTDNEGTLNMCSPRHSPPMCIPEAAS